MRAARRSPDEGTAVADQSGAGLLALGLVVAGPLAVVAGWLLVDDRPSVLPARTPVPVFAPVASGEGQVQVDVTLTWSPARALSYRGPAGLVTDVRSEIGDVLTNCTELFSVDGRQIRAIAAAQPLVAPVGQRSAGSDVLAVNRFLADCGYPVEVGDTWTDATATALGSYLADNHWPSQAEFDPSAVVWLADDEEFVVAGGQPVVGFPAPSPGDVAIEGMPRLIGAVLAGDAAGAGGGTLTIEGVSVQLEPDGSVGHHDLAALESVIPPGAESVPAGATPPGNEEIASIPPSSVIVTSEGRQCVTLAGRADVQHVVEVHVVGGVPGVTYVRMSPELRGASILVNPVETGADGTC